MTTDPVETIKAAAEQALAIHDPTERVRVITAIVDHTFKTVGADLKAGRQAAVNELRKTQTLKEIAADVDLSVSRVDQISKGVSRPKPKTPPAS